MSPGRRDRHRWLDSLARWAAGGRKQPSASKALVDSVSVVSGGSTRRTALRTAAGAAGAVALAGPLNLIQPRFAAAATTTAMCRENARKKAVHDFQACVRDPLQAFEASEEVIAQDTEYLKGQKKPSARRRLIRNIRRATRERAKAVRELEFCNGVYMSDSAEGESECERESTAPGASGGGGGPAGADNSGCEAGYAFCTDHCCDLSNAYCQSCPDKLICCRQGADCCPSG